jgi:hypothetical protein
MKLIQVTAFCIFAKIFLHRTFNGNFSILSVIIDLFCKLELDRIISISVDISLSLNLTEDPCLSSN